MSATTTPTPESARLETVRSYPTLADSLTDACRLAILVCARPMSAIELVLDSEVVVPAAIGRPTGNFPRAQSIAARLFGESSGVFVRDALQDPRLADLPSVTQTGGIRGYAAVPLISPEGHHLGLLSVADSQPRDFPEDCVESLRALSRLVMDQLNLGRRQRQLEELEAQHARVDAALREAESKFRSIFENTVVGIYQTTPEGRYLSANPMLARIYGYRSPDELMAAVGNIESQIYVDTGVRERFIEALQKADTITNFEARIRRKDSSVIWIAENARVVRDAAGDVRYYEGTVQDITARKQAEEQLRTSEMLYHSLVEDLPQNIFRKDPRERFIFANTRFCQTVGKSWDELDGGTDFDLFPPELAEKYQRDDQRVIREGKTIRMTEANITPDGEKHWVDVIKSPLRDVNGAIVGIQGIFWDVTETKRLQDDLAYERDLLQALLDHSPDSIYFKDAQARFLKVGRALARRFNITDPEQLVGRTVFDLLTPAVAAELHNEELQLMRTGVPLVNKVEEIIDNQGRRSWTSVTKVPISDRAGRILGLVGVARDITQLIEAEQALRDAEEKYRAIFENSVEGIFQTTPDGRFLQVNPALARIYGYSSPAELVAARTDVRTQVYVDPGRREEFVRQVLERGSITGFESEIYRKDGSSTWVSESARVVRDRLGNLVYFEGTLEDISARKQIEAEREKARQAALESARMKSEFVATVSHEIRTPLNAIVPSAERLLQTRLDRQQRYLGESIDHGAHMLLQIVNDILEVSRIEAGAVTLEAIDFDVHDVVERAVGFFASRAHAKRLELMGNILPGVPRQLRGDPARLGQILNNLLGNAIKFTERGEILLEVDVGESRDGGTELRFRVRDSGIGIAPESRARVFQAFAQADGSMARRYGGTGLGLTITRRFIELMGGTIDFESQVGEGTTFRFNVWLQPPAAPAADKPTPAVLAGHRVLLVDDNPIQLGVISGFLTALGAESVVKVQGMNEALVQLRAVYRSQTAAGIVLFDAELHGSDLLQIARRIRSASPVDCLLIAMVAPGIGADDRGLAAAGIAGTLVKPLRQTRLAADFASILSGEAPTEAAPAERETPEDGAGRGLVVLVVDDNPLNQRVAAELLRRLGASVDWVDNGPSALESMGRRKYDLILMDCQMPDMDGYETTRRIREMEAGSGPEHGRVPVVALSANALAGDRERGLAAGMDDYLTKPLRRPELARILREVGSRPLASAPAAIPDFTPPASGPEGPKQGPSADDSVPVIDPAPLLALASPEDPGAPAEFVRQFLAEAPGRLDRIEASLAAGKASSVRSEVHSLKGSASYMGARRLVHACAELEATATAGVLPPVGEQMKRLRSEFEAARHALDIFIATPSGLS